MKVIALKNIESKKYGSIMEGQEIEVIDSIGNDWIKNKLADGKGDDKGTKRTETEVKGAKPKSE